MKSLLKRTFIALSLVAGFALLAAPLTVDAAADPKAQACSGAGGTWVPGTGTTPGKCNQTSSGVKTLEASIQDIVNLLFFLIGTIAVIVIIIGGIKFITADGDASKIKSARETILYSVIGLVVAILAYAIVGFIIGRFA